MDRSSWSSGGYRAWGFMVRCESWSFQRTYPQRESYLGVRISWGFRVWGFMERWVLLHCGFSPLLDLRKLVIPRHLSSKIKVVSGIGVLL